MPMKATALLLILLLSATGTVLGQQANGEFRRGDCDVDGRVDLADAMALVYYLFQGVPGPLDCPDACDVNDDGLIDTGDLMVLIDFVAIDGTLPAPVGSCGLDPTADGLSCDVPCEPPVATAPSADHRIDLGYLLIWPQEITISVFIDTPEPLSGFSLGVCHDSAFFLINEVDVAPPLSQALPDLVSMAIHPDGFTSSVLISLFGSHTLPAGTSIEVLQVTYDYDWQNPSPITQICPCDSLGSNPVPLLMVDDNGISIVPTSACLELPALPLPPSGMFARGDCNDSGSFDISDEIFLLDYLFGQTQAVNCADACDNNDDGSINVADAVYGLAYLFGGGPELPDPFQVICGPDPTDDALDCTSYYCF